MRKPTATDCPGVELSGDADAAGAARSAAAEAPLLPAPLALAAGRPKPHRRLKNPVCLGAVEGTMRPGVDAGDAAADANGLGKEDASAPCGHAGAISKKAHQYLRPAANGLAALLRALVVRVRRAVRSR